MVNKLNAKVWYDIKQLQNGPWELAIIPVFMCYSITYRIAHILEQNKLEEVIILEASSWLYVDNVLLCMRQFMAIVFAQLMLHGILSPSLSLGVFLLFHLWWCMLTRSGTHRENTHKENEDKMLNLTSNGLYILIPTRWPKLQVTSSACMFRKQLSSNNRKATNSIWAWFVSALRMGLLE